jgi:hypothetical protein
VNHRLDHLVYATPNVEETVAQLGAALGITARPGGQHVGWGTHNYLASLGDGVYLEIVGPDPGQPDPDGPRPFLVDTLTGPSLVTWAMSVASMAEALRSCLRAGYDPGPAAAMSRATPDGATLSWELTSPPLASDGGILPFLIQWDTSVHPSATTVQGLRLESLTAHHPSPAQVNAQLMALSAPLRATLAPVPRLSARISGPSGKVVLHT